MVEFALVLPILVLILLGILQFGLLFWTQITLTQVARDTGRWVATQQTCDGAVVDVGAQANLVAANSTLFAWDSVSNPVSVTAGPAWTDATPGGGTVCAPPNNTEVWNVDFTLSHTVDVFLPIAADDCTGTCTRTLRSSVQYRVEPAPSL